MPQDYLITTSRRISLYTNFTQNSTICYTFRVDSKYKNPLIPNTIFDLAEMQYRVVQKADSLVKKIYNKILQKCPCYLLNLQKFLEARSSMLNTQLTSLWCRSVLFDWQV
jgi:hypothetical protein